MHFRQILGRILRVTGSKNQEAIMYMSAEPKLIEYAYRVNQDIPFEADIVKFEMMKRRIGGNINDGVFDTDTFIKPSPKELKLNTLNHFNVHIPSDKASEITDEHFLTSSYEKVVNIFGRFKQESIALGLSELR